MRRVGQVIDLRPDRIDDYEQLHAAVWPGVLAAIHGAHIRNYTIYRHRIRLFASFEYVGDDYAADMSRMAAVPRVGGAGPSPRQWRALRAGTKIARPPGV